MDPRIKSRFLAVEQFDKTKDLLRKFSTNEAYLNSSTSGSPRSDVNNRSSIFEDIYVNAEQDEVESYLYSLRETLQCDPLTFWKTNLKRYLKLANLARIVLAIQATSVSSEKTFSRAGLVNSALRNRLSPKSFRANVLLNSWLEYFNSS